MKDKRNVELIDLNTEKMCIGIYYLFLISSLEYITKNLEFLIWTSMRMIVTNSKFF